MFSSIVAKDVWWLSVTNPVTGWPTELMDHYRQSVA